MHPHVNTASFACDARKGIVRHDGNRFAGAGDGSHVTECNVATHGFFVPHDLRAPLAGARDGLLAGLTCAVKDMYDIAGERTGAGNPDWLATQTPATDHAAAIRRLLDAGATIIGKTICDEFFYSVAGVNAHYGTPANVRAPGRLPGGSSSGSAAAAAAGACDFALGSDTGGSVRIPAALCGLYGIRPTHGRTDMRGAMAMSPTFDTIGWLAPGPGVFRRVGQVLLAGARADAAIRNVMIADDAFAQADEPLAALLRDAVGQMADVPPKPTPGRLAPGGLDVWRDAVRVIQAYEIWQVYGHFITEQRPRFGPGVAERMQIASTITKDQADAARAVHAAARDHLRAVIAPGTIVALPSAPCIAPLVETPAKDLESYRIRVMRLTCIAGLGGLPQVSLPIGSVAGCPVGLSFIGWPSGDEVLLDLAVRLARCCGRAPS
jgi:amidase